MLDNPLTVQPRTILDKALILAAVLGTSRRERVAIVGFALATQHLANLVCRPPRNKAQQK